MIKSIQQFQSKGVERLEKVFCSYADDLNKVAEMVYGVTEEMIRLGTSIIAEEWEYYDGLLHDTSTMTNLHAENTIKVIPIILRKGCDVMKRIRDCGL